MVGSVFFFMASSQNYPGEDVNLCFLHSFPLISHIPSGGHAFSRLHELHLDQREVPRTVHIDVPAAMTGVSRFGQEFDAWRQVSGQTLTKE
jgi:hypothetical protein